MWRAVRAERLEAQLKEQGIHSELVHLIKFAIIFCSVLNMEPEQRSISASPLLLYTDYLYTLGILTSKPRTQPS